MVWDVLEAWGDDPPSHPVIHKSKGMDRVPPKPPLSDLADASNDFDVFLQPPKPPKPPTREWIPHLSTPIATKTAKTVTVGPWSFAEHLKPLRLEGPNKNELIPARSNFTKPRRY